LQDVGVLADPKRFLAIMKNGQMHERVH
jgi:hypothetical protein